MTSCAAPSSTMAMLAATVVGLSSKALMSMVTVAVLETM